MSKQTAVQWYIDQLEIKGDMRETQAIQIIQINIDSSEYLEIKRQALQMEREQIEDAVDQFYLIQATRKVKSKKTHNGGQDE